MKSLLLKLSLLGIITLGIAGFELLLPIDQYTFRAWEALSVKGTPKSRFLPAGSFYPRKRLERKEVGDIAAYTPNQVVKHVVWEIDDNGFRNSPGDCKHWPLVVAGDSVAVGTSLSQPHTLSSTLSRLTGSCTYNIGGVSISQAGEAMAQYGMAPRTLVLALNERGIRELRPLQRRLLEVTQPTATYGFWTPLWIALDRMARPPLAQFRNRHGFFKSVRRTFGRSDEDLVDGPNPRMTFYYGDRKAFPVTPAEMDRIVAGAADLNHKAGQEGMRLILVPVPDKESVYPELIPTKTVSPFMTDLYARLKEESVEFIDLYHPYREAFLKDGRLLYHLDDTHWNPEGVLVAARKITASLSLETREP